MATPRKPGGRATVPSRATHQHRLEGAIIALTKTFHAQVRRSFYTNRHYRALVFVRLISLPHPPRTRGTNFEGGSKRSGYPPQGGAAGTGPFCRPPSRFRMRSVCFLADLESSR